MRLDGREVGELAQDKRGRWHLGAMFGRERDDVVKRATGADAVQIGAHVRPTSTLSHV